MPTDRTTISLSDLMRRAAAIVDPDGDDPAVAELVDRHLDDDEPVRGLLPTLAEHIRFGADEEPAVVMTQAIVLYLAHRLDEVDDDGERVLRLAVRAEFADHPEEPLASWLAERGVAVG